MILSISYLHILNIVTCIFIVPSSCEINSKQKEIKFKIILKSSKEVSERARAIHNFYNENIKNMSFISLE